MHYIMSIIRTDHILRSGNVTWKNTGRGTNYSKHAICLFTIVYRNLKKYKRVVNL